MQWAYLFERFPSWTQTFCYREVVEMERQGMAPWIYSIRRPQGEPPQNFPAGLARRVRYLPEEGELGDEFRWLKRCDRLPESLRVDEQRFKGGRDKARLQEAGWLGGQMKLAGIGHVHTHFAGIAARTAYWLHRHHGIGYSFTAHANDVFCPPDPDLSLTLEELVDAARFVVAVSDFGAAQLRERFPSAAGKIFRVYNGIDVDAFPLARPARNGPRIVGVGRYIEKKGFDDLIAACAALRDRGVDFDCRIVGEGPLEGELQAAIDRANLRERVILTGPKPLAEVGALLGTARVFALPCVVEADGGMDNLPTVVAEAMAAGLPVVSTTLAGVPEMVVDGRSGALVPPRSVDKLADALARMLAEPAAAEASGAEGRKRARELFDLKVTGREFKGVLLEQTSINPPRGTWWREPTLAWNLRRKRRGKLRPCRLRFRLPAFPAPGKLPEMDKPMATDVFLPWTWEAICDDPFLQDLPFKIELNRYNQIVMSPANTFHSRYQTRIAYLLQRLLKGGESIVELALMTSDNVKVPDVVWASKKTLKAHAKEKINWSGPPEICVEVISPRNTRAEIEEKRALYLEGGAREVWVCGLDGEMSFFSAVGELEKSGGLCPKFPQRVKL